jgi:hypothetical protein
MENPAADQLPEVDSLPDGFVESAVEPLSPSTPAVEHEKPVRDYKEEKLLEPELSPQLLVNDSPSTDGIVTENAEKLRTFPVSLSENDSFDAQKSVEEVTNKGSLEPSGGAVVGEEPVRGISHASEQPIQGDVSSQVAQEKGLSSSKSIEIYKKTETSEVKRKSVKRSVISEKEFLEFTLKYQQVLSERDSAIAVRDKLESLCRELQRQNKVLMEECKRVSTEGQSLRLDLSTRFQDAIKEVSSKLEERKDESLAQLKENEMLRIKMNQLAEQYALTEQQFTQKLKQKTLELQIADLKIQQHEEKSLQEQSQMKLYADQISKLLATEKNLRLQLTADGEKFQQFQDALLKSNEVFETFKQEIEKMAKSIKELRKENTFLKGKTEKSDITLIELVEEREHLKKMLEKTKNQKEKLESLCRSLQAERKQILISQLSSDSGSVST